MPILKKEVIQDKVYKNSLNTCIYITGYENSNSIITVKCLKHNNIFTTKWENIRRDNRAHHICPICQQEDIDNRYKENQIEVECAYCHNKFIRPLSKISNSKSGLYFCCREHKDLAQRISSGKEFENIRPEHYGKDSAKDYRSKAFQIYKHECAVCKWKEDEQILQVHHIDKNHENNDINNLIILCPNCHAKITFGRYKLIDRTEIIKI